MHIVTKYWADWLCVVKRKRKKKVFMFRSEWLQILNNKGTSYILLFFFVFCHKWYSACLVKEFRKLNKGKMCKKKKIWPVILPIAHSWEEQELPAISLLSYSPNLFFYLCVLFLFLFFFSFLLPFIEGGGTATTAPGLSPHWKPVNPKS